METKLKISEIVEKYSLPVKIKKESWSSDFYVVIDHINKNNAICTAYKNGKKYNTNKKYRYSLTTEVILISGQPKEPILSTKIDNVESDALRQPIGDHQLKSEVYTFTEETYNYGFEQYKADSRAKEYEPDQFIHLIDRERIIDSYLDTAKNEKEDTDYILTSKSHCIARMDVDIAFMPCDHRFCRHYYTKLYISDKTVGKMEILADQTVWQVEAGIYKRIPPKEIRAGYNYDYYYDSGLVLDWRSPLADLYYSEEDTTFLSKKIYEYEHNLLLKRRFESGRGKNLFIAGKVQADDGTTFDEYLISVLESRKYETGLSDIIRTIQSNQNKIIRKDKDINIIVQGCAGSGKTMILLHRLSVIAYNNPRLSPSMYEIITPNKMFDTQINDLAKRLDLKSVKRRTPEELYTDILSVYCKDYGENIILPDIEAPNEIVEYVYSDIFEAKTAKLVSSIKEVIIKKKISALNVRELNKISVTFGLDEVLPVVDSNDEYSKFNTLLSYKKRILDKIGLLNNYNLKICELDKSIKKDCEKIRKLLVKDSNLKSIGFSSSDTAWINTFFREKQTELKSILSFVGGSDAELIFADAIIRIDENTKASIIVEYLNTLKISGSEFEKSFLSRDINDEREFNSTYKQKREEIVREARKLGLDADIVCSGREKLDYALNLIKNIDDELINLESVFSAEKIFNQGYKKIIHDNYPDFNISATYRHTLYAHILFYWYYTEKKLLERIRTVTGKYIFIDEAQDFSCSELKLLKDIMQDDTVFNLYGDEDQIIRPYSIQKWSDISSIFDAEIEYIRENYRNTINITKYCNETLGHNNTAIGVIGDPVDNISFNDAIDRIKNDPCKNQKTAFIVSNIDNTSSKKLISALSNYLSVNSLSGTNAVLLSLEMAKGLEFDNVYVLNDGFSPNGFYIACTRARFKLIIVSPDYSI